MSILIGKRHINYFTQLHDIKNDQKLASQIRIFEKKLILQFAPIELLQAHAKALAAADFIVDKSRFIRQNSAGVTSHFNDYELRDLTRQNGSKLRRILHSDFYQNCNILDCISPKLYGSLCVDLVKDLQLSEFLELCRTSAHDLYKSKNHILSKGFYELDKTFILSILTTLSIRTGNQIQFLQL